MKVLVIGNGGREHALAWKISESDRVSKIYCAPGNGGISLLAERINIKSDDINGLLNFALKNKIDLTVVGPELPLVRGIVNKFESEGLKIFGPRKEAALLEGSKVFTKIFLKKYNIPTADFEIFEDPESAKSFVKKYNKPVVVKADGLAGGKGSIVCKDKNEAIEAINIIMEKKVFGDAGNKIVIEDFIYGEEVSFMVFTDGKNVSPLPSSQDHKAIFDDDKGPNTGGMGAYSPAPIIDKVLYEKIINYIINPTIEGLENERITYKGILYAGLIIEDGNPKVLEFNVRFGDPETQPILVKMKSDIISVFEAVVEGRLPSINIEWDDKYSVCVVMASKGYPEKYEKGFKIYGLENDFLFRNSFVFHAGTEIDENKNLITNGGRVLGIVSIDTDLKKAIDRVYSVITLINFEGAYFRKDIGRKGLKWITH
jgi:phosphoribosylamine--glycine ligase